MKISIAARAIALCAFTMPASAGIAATLIPVPPVPGSTSTFAGDINDNNVVAGGYTTADGVMHGFTGALAGPYTTFDYTQYPVDGTAPRSINNDGVIVGYAPAVNEGWFWGPEFIRFTDGRITTIGREKGRHFRPFDGAAQGIADDGVSTGDYLRISDTFETAFHGYLAHNGIFGQKVVLPFKQLDPPQTHLRGINRTGTIVGYFHDKTPTGQHGFILQNGMATQIDYPGAGYTLLEDINDNGVVVGIWGYWDKNKNFAFILDTATGTFTDLNFGHSPVNQAWSINNAGLVALVSGPGSYIYCPRKPANCPAGGTAVPDGRMISVSLNLLRPAKRMVADHGGRLSSGLVRGVQLLPNGLRP